MHLSDFGCFFGFKPSRRHSSTTDATLRCLKFSDSFSKNKCDLHSHSDSECNCFILSISSFVHRCLPFVDSALIIPPANYESLRKHKITGANSGRTLTRLGQIFKWVVVSTDSKNGKCPSDFSDGHSPAN